MADNRDLVWEEISTEHIIRDRWIDLRRSAFRFPDGRVFEPYYSYTRRDYAVIVASSEDGRYLCVRQFRQGIRKVTAEFPAGGIEPGDSPGTAEDRVQRALRAAKRELLEETGFTSERWTYLMRVPASATISDNYAYLFAAENCRETGQQKLDEMELLRVEQHTPEELEEMIRTEDFAQADHILAWMLWKSRNEKK